MCVLVQGGSPFRSSGPPIGMIKECVTFQQQQGANSGCCAFVRMSEFKDANADGSRG
jgi:hypothetical protein